MLIIVFLIPNCYPAEAGDWPSPEPSDLAIPRAGYDPTIGSPALVTGAAVIEEYDPAVAECDQGCLVVYELERAIYGQHPCLDANPVGDAFKISTGTHRILQPRK